jgi:hypothetical protein
MTAESGLADQGKTSAARQQPVNALTIPGPSLRNSPQQQRTAGSSVFYAVRLKL